MADQIANDVESLQINDPGGDSASPNAKDDIEVKWLFPLPELYKLALNFYKGSLQKDSLFCKSNLFLTFCQLPVCLIFN